jgi:septal ring factor EnvC (AmiA/AmiB activator)
MRFVALPFLALSLAAVPAFSQTVQTNVVAVSAAATSGPSDGTNPSAEFQALREQLAAQNKSMVDQTNVQRTILKKNQDLLKEAQRINASNLKLAEEQKKIAAQIAELTKQREALVSTQKPTEMASK